MFLLRLLLILIALTLLALAGGIVVTLLWLAPWPPGDAASDRHAYLLVAAFTAAAALCLTAAVRLGRSRSLRVSIARLLPYPMNNDG